MDQNHIENLLVEVSENGVIAVHGEIRHTALLQHISPGIVALDKYIRAAKSWAEPQDSPGEAHETD